MVALFAIGGVLLVGVIGLIGNHPPQHDNSAQTCEIAQNGVSTCDKQ